MFGWLKSECPRCAEREARLLAEIESNRLREAEFMDTIIRLTTGTPVEKIPGSRTPLVEIKNADTDDDADEIDPALEPIIQKRADEFVEEAAKRGNIYTEAQRDDLVRQIREDPDEYL